MLSIIPNPILVQTSVICISEWPWLNTELQFGFSEEPRSALDAHSGDEQWANVCEIKSAQLAPPTEHVLQSQSIKSQKLKL